MQLAEQASFIEINILGNPIGKQDQFAAAYGGLNIFKFQKSGEVIVENFCNFPFHISKYSLKKQCLQRRQPFRKTLN